MDYDHLDPEGSLMDKIQALIQPPQSEDSGKRVKKVDKEARKQGRAVNNDNCDSCGEGGDLLCCDRCPCAFHLSCCDPPLEEDDIPDGEWLCNECKANPPQDDQHKEEDEEMDVSEHEDDLLSATKEMENSKPESPFSTLAKMNTGKNPTTFTLPPELKCNTFFPGDRKRKSSTEERVPPVKNGKRNGDEEEHSVPPDRLCFACSRSGLASDLVHCDFCPLAFHMDCVNPPLTTIPNGMWMCPNHAEHAEPGLRDPRFSKRCQAYNDLRSNISQHTIKLNFLQRVQRLKRHPAFRRKRFLPTKRRATLVPQAIKDHYNFPPLRLLPENIRKMQEPLPLHSLPVNTPTPEEQEEWLKCVIGLQCGIAKHLTQVPVHKTLVSNHVENSSAMKAETANLNALSASGLAAAALSVTGKEPAVNGLHSKSDLTNHVSASSGSSVPNACISRVVTTTITSTSGGKTVTKPLTILYASPSKFQAHMNGPLNAKSVMGSNNPVNVCSVASTHLPSQVMVKQETKAVEKQLPSGDLNQLSAECKQLSNDTAKLINDVGHLNNVKSKISIEGIKTVAGPSSSCPVNTMVSAATRTGTVSTVTVAGSSNNVSSTSTAKVAPSTPTKLIVLTSTNSGNILKTIATAGLPTAGAGQIPGGSIVTLGAPGTGASVNPVKIGAVNATTPLLLSSSPKSGQASAATSVATANAINSICAAAGVDAFNELAKLDPRLIQVLAYQRLQQLLTQTKPVPPSPVSSRKISFNGLKETIVLPQHTVPAGRSIAVLCPLTGTGPVCPMIHKCLSMGQGPDMDVYLQEYGHCNFISEKHCAIFYDETSKQYELINYSEHGTYVDNVLYSCDFSDKVNRHMVSSKDLDPSKVSKSKLLAAAQLKQNSKPKGSRRTVGLGVQKIVKPCNCTTSSSNLIGGSGAGWEGTALLHHGSYIKLGCAQFVFSVTSHATKSHSGGKASSSNVKKPSTS